MIRAVTLLSLLVGLPSLVAADFSVSEVYHEPVAFDPRVGQSVTVGYRLSAPARAALNVFDGRDLRVRRIESERVLPAGDHRFVWDGRDHTGDVVPAEAYVYTVEATEESGTSLVWDLADATGGESIPIESLRWDPAAARVTYSVAQPSRVRIRIGLASEGPLLRTLLDWVARGPGPHSEAWDGMDGSDVIDLAKHPSLDLVGEAFSLPRSAILVGREPSRVAFVANLQEPRVERRRSRLRSPRMFDYAAQPIEKRRDFPVHLELPSGIERGQDGLVVVRGPLAVRVTLEAGDFERVVAERFEVSFFLDGRFVWENEVGFLPMSWVWDPRGSNPGTHYLTANIRGYDGHFGAATVRVEVKPEAGAAGGRR